MIYMLSELHHYQILVIGIIKNGDLTVHLTRKRLEQVKDFDSKYAIKQVDCLLSNDCLNLKGLLRWLSSEIPLCRPN